MKTDFELLESAGNTAGLLFVFMFVCLLSSPLPAKGITVPDSSTCFASALNRTAEIDKKGEFILSNIPAGIGNTRIRINCFDLHGTLKSGYSQLFELKGGQRYGVGEMKWDSLAPIPERVAIRLDSGNGDIHPAFLWANYPDGSWVKLPDTTSATQWFTSNPNIAGIDSIGRIRARSSGRVLVTAIYEGVSALLEVRFETSGDTDGDSIPDDWEITNGLNPNLLLDGLEDPDKDGLNNRSEYRNGTDPRRADSDNDGLADGDELVRGTSPIAWDTDIDGVSDGLEVTLGTNPMDPNSVDWARALASLGIDQPFVQLTSNAVLPGEVKRKLRVLGRTLDGREIDLTRKPSMAWTTSQPAVAWVGPEPGLLQGGSAGQATVTASFAGKQATTSVTVSVFIPRAISVLELGIHANRIKVSGGFAYIATDSGLLIVDVSNPARPQILSSLALPGPGYDLLVRGSVVWLALANAGISSVDVSDPFGPSVLGSLSTQGVAMDLAEYGDSLLVANGTEGLFIADIHDPSAPMNSNINTWVERRNIRTVAASRSRGQFLVGADHGPVLLGMISPEGWAAIGPSVLLNSDSTSHPADLLWNRTGAWAAAGAGLSLSSLRTIEADPYGQYLAVSKSAPDNLCLKALAVEGRVLVGADIYMVNALPIFDIGSGDELIARGEINFTGLLGSRDDNGSGVDILGGYAYLVASQAVDAPTTDGQSSRLYIGRVVQPLLDTSSIAPKMTWVSPDTTIRVLKQRNPLSVVLKMEDEFIIRGVELFLNGQSIGQKLKSPWSWDLRLPDTGATVRLLAVATDFGGNIGRDSLELELQTDSMPVVTWLQPRDSLQAPAGSLVGAAVEVTDDTYLTVAELWVADTLYARYDYPSRMSNWVISASENAGIMPIRVRVVDAAGNEAWSRQQVVKVVPDTSEPIVWIVSPGDSARIMEGKALTISVSAAAVNPIRKLELFDQQRSTVLEKASSWQLRIIADGVGMHLVRAHVVTMSGKEAWDSIWVDVYADPRTTVSGQVVDASGGPVAGASVKVEFGGVTTTGVDGRFSLGGVRTVRTIAAEATATIGDIQLVGHPELVAATGATTDLGAIVMDTVGGQYSWGNSWLGLDLSGMYHSSSTDPGQDGLVSSKRMRHIPGFKKLHAAPDNEWDLFAEDSAGGLWAWGNSNVTDALGIDTISSWADIYWPTPVLVPKPIRSFDIGVYDLSLAIDSIGRSWAFGMSEGREPNITRPTVLDSLPLLKDVHAWTGNRIGLDSNGNVWAWGINATQLGVDSVYPDGSYPKLFPDQPGPNYVPPTIIPGLPKIREISFKYPGPMCAFDDLRRVWIWGWSAPRDREGYPRLIPDLTGVKTLLSDGNGYLALLEEGTLLRLTGRNGQSLGATWDNLKVDTLSLGKVKDVICGGYNACAISMIDGRIYHWRGTLSDSASFENPSFLDSLVGFTPQVYSSYYGLHGLDSQGRVGGWGFQSEIWYNWTFWPSAPETYAPMKYYSVFPDKNAEYNHFLNRNGDDAYINWTDSSGYIWTYGYAENLPTWLFKGRFDDGPLVRKFLTRPIRLDSIYPAMDIDVNMGVAIYSDGSIKMPVDTGMLTRYQLNDSIRSYHSYNGVHVVLDVKGKVWCWASNREGRELKALLVGQGQLPDSVPEVIPSLSGITKVALSRDGLAALSNEGQIYTFGLREWTSLFPNAHFFPGAPVKASVTNAVDLISTPNQDAFYAVTSEGEVWAWGNILGSNNTVTQWVPLSIMTDVRSLFTLQDGVGAVRRDGRAYLYGGHARIYSPQMQGLLPGVKNVRASIAPYYSQTQIFFVGPSFPEE